jgi:hypothetical protein
MDLSADHWHTYDLNIAPYLRAHWRLGALALDPGLRLETFVLDTSRVTPRVGDTPAVGRLALHTYLEPRIEARWHMTHWLVLGARGGLHHQAPDAVDRSAVFGNPSLSPAHGSAVAGGPALQLGDLFALETVAFFKRMDGLSVRSNGRPPALAEAWVDGGSGRSYGAQMTLSVARYAGVAGGLAYTWSRSTRRDAAGDVSLFDEDRTHVLCALTDYLYGDWTLALRMRFASGAPRTEVLAAYYQARDARYEPLFGPHNAARLPVFASLDVHVERRFRWRALEGAVGVDLLNVANHRNVEEVAYNEDFSSRRDILGLPLLAVLGISLEL